MGGKRLRSELSWSLIASQSKGTGSPGTSQPNQALEVFIPVGVSIGVVVAATVGISIIIPSSSSSTTAISSASVRHDVLLGIDCGERPWNCDREKVRLRSYWRECRKLYEIGMLQSGLWFWYRSSQVDARTCWRWSGDEWEVKKEESGRKILMRYGLSFLFFFFVRRAILDTY